MTRCNKERKKGKKKPFAEFRYHPVWLIPFHYHFHEATFWIQWEQNRKFAVSFECSVISYSVYICDPPPPRARRWRPSVELLADFMHLESTQRNETKREKREGEKGKNGNGERFRRSSQGNDREEFAGRSRYLNGARWAMVKFSMKFHRW